MRIFQNLNINFLGKRTIFYFISATLILLGFLNILTRGLHLGIDFKGGTEIALQFEKPIDITQIRNDVDNLGLGSVEVKTFGSSNDILLRTDLQEIPANVIPKVKSKIESIISNTFPGLQKHTTDSTSTTITIKFPDNRTAEILNNKLFEAGFQTSKAIDDTSNTSVIVRFAVSDLLKENLAANYKNNPFIILKEDKVGPKVGQELKKDAVIAVMLSLVVILIYISFRFKFTFAIGAVVALFHDVLITLGLFSVLYGVIPGLNLEFSLTVVAAFLTLIGYSMNDTVVVFDRVREHLKLHKTLPLEENINQAINKTFSRTIITGLATVFSIIVLIIFGGEVLRGFAFALFIGMITGTYSSIFVASAFVLEYATRAHKKIEF